MTMPTTTSARTPITYDEAKFRELLLYIAERSVGDDKFGKTKLNKLLYFSDFLAYGIFGKPITGAAYQRRPYGPVPRQITRARDALIASGAAVVDKVDRFGFPQERLVAKRPPNLSIFSQREKELVDQVIDTLWSHSGVEASELSHRELGWQITNEGQTIPYGAVFLSSRRLSSNDIERGVEVFKILEADAA